MKANWVWLLLLALTAIGCRSGVDQGSWKPTWLGGEPEPQPLGSSSAEVVAALQSRKADQTPSFTERLWQPIERMTSASESAADELEHRDRLSLDVPSQANPQLYCRLAAFAESKGSWNQARELYQQALSMDSTHLESQLGLARLLNRLGETQMALTQYEQAAKDHPSAPQVQNDLGLFHQSHGQVDLAIESFSRAIQLEPDSRRYRNNLAALLTHESAYDDAVNVLLGATDPATAYLTVSIMARKQGSLEEAQRLEERARAETASLPPTHMARQYFAARATQ
ncbi:MAG: tetratricopeptide repeat protein [Pirellulaceae bacterium]